MKLKKIAYSDMEKGDSEANKTLNKL